MRPRSILLLVALAVGLTVLVVVQWRRHASPGSHEPIVLPPAAVVTSAAATAAVADASSTGAVAATVVDLAPLNELRTLIREDKLGEARQKAMDLLSATSNSAAAAQIEELLGGVHVKLVMAPYAMPEKVDYVVAKGDSVAKIAQKYGTTVDLVMKANNLAKPNLIKVGDRYRVFTGKFSITVNKTRNELLLQMNGAFFKRYRVGTGKFGRTPAGAYVISERIVDPPWWRSDGRQIPYGDKENILGTRWMALKATGTTADARGYGIHGTWDESTIGKSESAGCVRLKNQDVEELFALVPVGTTVAIEE